MRRVTNILTGIICVALLGCDSKDRFGYKISIEGVAPGVTNCYQRDNQLTWYSEDSSGDLVVIAKMADGIPLKLCSIRSSKHEMADVWLMEYQNLEVVKGNLGNRTSLKFLHIEGWDDRVMKKKFWPWPKELIFHLDSSDGRITKIERREQNSSAGAGR